MRRTTTLARTRSPSTYPAEGPYLISAASNLPDIGEAVVIDGTSRPGYDNAPVIEVRGPSGSSQAFFSAADHVTIKGLSITNWGEAIKTVGPVLTVADDWIGIDPANTFRANRVGVTLTSSGAHVTGSRILGKTSASS